MSGSLANSDERPLQGKNAKAEILAVDGADKPSGIASVHVDVDGKIVAQKKVRCGGRCPESTRFEYAYDAKQFGPSKHVIDVVATTKAGNSVTRRINIERAVSVKASGAPQPVPAFYLTAPNARLLNKQSAKAAAKVARQQDSGHTLLVLDYGAARLKDGKYGSSLRSGTFFSNEELKGALEAAAKSYERNYKRGDVTLVLANSNGHISKPRSGFTTFTEDIARKAGEDQGKTITDLKLPKHMKAAVGGDIEPGFDGNPKISIAMVEGAVDGAGGRPYYNFGTAPCEGKKCVNGWQLKHVCAVNTGGVRSVLPEIYNVKPVDQSAVWAKVRNSCKIKKFAGASANQLAELKPRQSWLRLKQKGGIDVGEALVVWPK